MEELILAQNSEEKDYSCKISVDSLQIRTFFQFQNKSEFCKHRPHILSCQMSVEHPE